MSTLNCQAMMELGVWHSGTVHKLQMAGSLLLLLPPLLLWGVIHSTYRVYRAGKQLKCCLPGKRPFVMTGIHTVSRYLSTIDPLKRSQSEHANLSISRCAWTRSAFMSPDPACLCCRNKELNLISISSSPIMASRGSKIALAGTSLFAVSTIIFVHFQQQAEKAVSCTTNDAPPPLDVSLSPVHSPLTILGLSPLR